MVTYVFDASGVIRYLDGEAGGTRVHEILKLTRAQLCRSVMSAVNWGEVVSNLAKRAGDFYQEDVLQDFRDFGLEIVPATAKRAEDAARVKHAYKIPYADAFGVELATDSPDHILVTADFDVKPSESLIRIEFLPTKSQSQP